ncbi:hypothetical protein KC339_g73 [Hortaea werneckii]|nr:hypothetical protein KC339_g73 [Hortaea werneckii]
MQGDRLKYCGAARSARLCVRISFATHRPSSHDISSPCSSSSWKSSRCSSIDPNTTAAWKTDRVERFKLDYGEDARSCFAERGARSSPTSPLLLSFAKERGVTRRTSSFRSSDLQAEVASDLLARRTAARYNVWRLGSIEHAGVVWTQHRLEEIQIILTQIAHGRANGQNQWRLDTHQRAVLELRFTVELRPPDLSCIVALISQSYYDVSIFLGRMRNDVRIVADMVVEVDAKPCSIACW